MRSSASSAPTAPASRRSSMPCRGSRRSRAPFASAASSWSAVPHRSGASSAPRATFQDLGLVRAESVQENLLLSQTWLARYAAAVGILGLGGSVRTEHELRRRGGIALEVFGLDHLGGERAGLAAVRHHAHRRDRGGRRGRARPAVARRGNRRARPRRVTCARRPLSRHTGRARSDARHRRAPRAARRACVRLRVLPRVGRPHRRRQAPGRDGRPARRGVVPRRRRRERRGRWQ